MEVKNLMMPLQAAFPVMKTLNEVRTLRIVHSGSDIANVYIPALYRHSGKTGSHEIKIVQIVNIPMSFAHSGISSRSCKNFFSRSDNRCQGDYPSQEA